MISSPAKKRIKKAIWKLANPSAGQVPALILMFIESGLMQLHMHHPCDSADDASKRKPVPLKNVHIALSKEYKHSGNEFETLSIHVDSRWVGIPFDA